MDAKTYAINKAREKDRLLRAISKLRKENSELSNLVEAAFKEGHNGRMVPGVTSDQAWIDSDARQILKSLW